MTTKRKCKRELRRCAAKIRLVEKIFRRELCKPIENRDNDLIDECMETLEYLENTFAKLSEKMDGFKGSSSVPRIFSPKRFAICFVLAILLACTIAQALGLRIWSTLIYWDADHLHIGYVANAQPSTLPLDPKSNGTSATTVNREVIDPAEYPSIEAAFSALGFDSMPVMPTMIAESAARIWGVKTISNTMLQIDYLLDDGNMINYEINFISEQANATLAFTVPGSGIAYEVYRKDDIDYIIAQLDDGTFITWSNGDFLYSITSTYAYEAAFDIIDSLETFNP